MVSSDVIFLYNGEGMFMFIKGHGSIGLPWCLYSPHTFSYYFLTFNDITVQHMSKLSCVQNIFLKFELVSMFLLSVKFM